MGFSVRTLRFTILFIIVLFLLFSQGQAQNTTDSSSLSAKLLKGKLSLEGYVDVYFCYSFNHPKDATHPYFVSFNRDNEVNVNLAYISLKYTSDRVRATFTPGWGTYMNANYASERQTLQNILEADVGVKLFKNKDIWLDAGVIASPYTNENAYSFDQIPYTRSLGAENVPYFLTGAKLTLPLDTKWTLYLYLLNGWQVIEAQHDPLDFGSQLEFKPNDKWDINFNTYIGNEASSANPGYKTRYFGDLYASFIPSEKWSFTADAYVGWQQRMEGQTLMTRNWWNVNACARYTFAPGNSFSARVEDFNDPYTILEVPVTSATSFKLASFSLGYNLAVTDQVLVRLEGRYFGSPEQLYPLRDGTNTNKDLWLTVGMTARFR
jgi:Putative beta-barrel porin-2, OmpL-like. bbp2